MSVSAINSEGDRPWRESYTKAGNSTPSWSRQGMPYLFEKFLSLRKQAGVTGYHLDVGCGDGAKTINFAANGLPSFGIDKVENGVKKARLLAQEKGVFCNLAVADATTFNPLGDGTVGSLSDSLMGTHLKFEDWEAYMIQLKRILQPKALLLFVLFSDKDEHFHGHTVSQEYTFDFQQADSILEPDLASYGHYHGMYNKHFGLGDIVERVGSNFGILETEEVQHPNYSYRRLWNVIAQMV